MTILVTISVSALGVFKQAFAEGISVNAQSFGGLGKVVVVKHEDGLTTSYQGLGNVEVAAGDKVKQGQVLGKAGQSVIKKDLGLHVHFSEYPAAVSADSGNA